MREGDQRGFSIPYLFSHLVHPCRDRRLPLVVLIVAVGSIAFLWLTKIPLGVPGEWTWTRIRIDPNQMDEALLGLLLAALAAAAYTAICWAGAKRLERASRWETTLWMGGLTVVGFFWLGLVQESPPTQEHRLFKGPLVLYEPGASGYFFHARNHIHDLHSFLVHYEQRMAQGDVLHVGTHPPGLFLFHEALIDLCERSPRFTDLLLQTCPQSVEEAFRLIDADLRPPTGPLRNPDRAALWLAVLLTQFVAAATVIPLYLLLRRAFSRQTSWMTAVFWPLVPAVAVFLPKSDALYPFLATAFLVTWLEGWTRRSAKRQTEFLACLLCVLAGLLFWLGMLFSLALLPVGLLAALLTVWEAPAHSLGWISAAASFVSPLRRLAYRLRSMLVPVLSALGAFLAASALLWMTCDLNLFNVWAWNLHNHAAFYDQYPRSYWKWLLVNPLELALAVGLPIVVLVFRGFQNRVSSARSAFERSLAPFWCCAVVWGLVWLSGKNMGEAARLWLVFMPWLVWLAGDAWNGPVSTGDDDEPRRLRSWVVILLLQAAVCIATAARVNGFPLLLTNS